MNIKINQIQIYTKNNMIVFDLDPSITFIYGGIGVGKTTLISLILYCLGGDLIETPAVNDQFISASVKILINSKEYVMRREFKSSRIFIKAENGDVRNLDKKDLSSFLYKEANINSVYYSRKRVDTPYQLTIKNYLWFTYLNQSDIDSNFFYLGNDANEHYKIASINTLASLLGQKSFVNEVKKEEISNIRKRLRKYENGVTALEYVFNDLFDEFYLSECNKLEAERIKLKRLFETKREENKYSNEEMNLLETQMELTEYKFNFISKFMPIRSRHNKFVLEYERLKQQVNEFERKLVSNNDNVFTEKLYQLGETFKACLLKINFPSVSASDKVVFNSQDLYPTIVNEYTKIEYNFDSLGSGGKKTLFKICFLLAIHIQAREQDDSENRLPTLVIIDTPMKNISEREDRGLFDTFYAYLLELSKTVLSDTQFLIIDKEKNKIITAENAEIILMSKNNPLFPEFVNT